MTSLVPSAMQRSFLEKTTEAYHNQLRDESDVCRYLMETRGLSPDSVRYFRLGYVADPVPGHEQYAGRIVIPYLTPAGITALRFRRYDPDPEHPEYGPKYMSAPGEPPRIFNAPDLQRPESVIYVTEGEVDAMTAHQCGLPAIGIAGVHGHRPAFFRCLKGYEVVHVLADNDDKGEGEAFAESIAERLRNVRIHLMPDGHDVNSFFVAEGKDAFLSRIAGHQKGD